MALSHSALALRFILCAFHITLCPFIRTRSCKHCYYPYYSVLEVACRMLSGGILWFSFCSSIPFGIYNGILCFSYYLSILRKNNTQNHNTEEVRGAERLDEETHQCLLISSVGNHSVVCSLPSILFETKHALCHSHQLSSMSPSFSHKRDQRDWTSWWRNTSVSSKTSADSWLSC